MKQTTFSLLGLVAVIALSVGTPATAGQFAQLEEAHMDVIDSGHKHKFAKKHKRGKETRRIVTEYMLENGDITQAEIDAHKAQRKATRSELKALRDSGDEDALYQRLKKERQQRHERKEKMLDYIHANPELAKVLKERRKAFREQRKGWEKD